MATLPKVLTLEEWLNMPVTHDGKEEVVNGKILRMPPASFPHAEIIEEIIAQLIGQIDRKKVRILGSIFGVLIRRDPLTCRCPDLGLFWKERDIVQNGIHCVPPDLVIEVLSPSENRQRKEAKIADYASIAAPEVWLVSPEAGTIEVRVLKQGAFQRVGIFAEGTLEPTKFPGVKLDINSIWP